MYFVIDFLWSHPILTILVGCIAALFYRFNRQFNLCKDLSQVGYDNLIEGSQYGRWKNKTNEEIAKDLSKVRKIGKVPPIYPNGWFAILESCDIKKGQVKNVSVLGENLVVFRGTVNGEVFVLDAYCPHLGANMGVGGKVKGDCIECPFHEWTFKGSDGRCASVPYSTKTPDFARAKTWISREINSYVFIWYHAENAEPTWEIEPYPELPGWVFSGRNEYYVNAHIQEIPENGADVAHLNAIHGASLLAGGDIRKSDSIWGGGWYARHVWGANWQTFTEDGLKHKALMNLTHEFRLFKMFPLIKMNVTVHQIGPGYVELNLATSFGNAVILQTVTPVGPMIQKVVHRLYTPNFFTFYCNIIMSGESCMFERDLMVWNHKKFVEKPILVTEDQAIVRYRRWYSQFYSENSPRLGEQKKSLDW